MRIRMRSGTAGRCGVHGALAAVLLVGASACAGANQEPSADNDPCDTSKPLSMTMGTQGLIMQSGYAALAEELGYFKDENLTVEPVRGEITSNSVQALVGGSMDGYLGGPEAIAAREQGADVIFVAGAANSPIWDIVTTPDIKKLKDLEGKRVAVSAEASISTVSVRQALEAQGVDTSDIKYVPAGGTSKRYAALQAGHVKAAPLGIPQSYEAVDKGMTNFGNTATLGAPPITSALFTVSRQWAEENTPTLTRFLRAYLRVIGDLYDPEKKEQMQEAISKALEMPPEYAERAHDELFLDSKDAVQTVSRDGSVDPKALQVAADASLEFGALKEKIDAKKMIENSYLEKARASLKRCP